MNIRKHLKPGYKLISVRQAIKLASQNVFLPFYHSVNDQELPHISNLYPLRGVGLFIEDMDYLCRHFKPINIKELTFIADEDQPPREPIFHLTFDDGLSEIYTVIAPILEIKGIPATFFINTDFLDNKDLFYRYKVSLIIGKLKADSNCRQKLAEMLQTNDNREGTLLNSLLGLKYKDIALIDTMANTLEIDFDTYLSSARPYLSTEQVKDLLNRGFSIGSHSSAHPLFFDIDEIEQKKQVADSFEFLEERFHINERYFSFPFSDMGIGRAFFDWLYNEQKCRLSFGISGLKHDYSRLHLHRVPFEGTLRPASEIVKEEYLYYILKSIIGKNHIRRK